VTPEPVPDGALRRILVIAGLSAAAGALYGVFAHGSAPVGALVGAVDAGILSWVELIALARWAGSWQRRLPFSAWLAMRLAIYLAVVFVVAALSLPLLSGGAVTGAVNHADVMFAISMCVVANILLGVDELLGSGALFAFVAGRYHRPRREERVLLYLDLIGSTSKAEKLGEERFLDLLNAFFADVTDPIVREGGDIHKYVGDEVIAVWPAAADPARPIRACFAAIARLEAARDAYLRGFGVAPAFCAAVHAGPVVIGELGARKKEIALIGDAMNTAARILEAARETGEDLLVSASCYDRLRSPLADVVARRLAPVQVRGKAAPLELVALSREGWVATPLRVLRA
jgi:adenylate cyclase